MTTIPAPSEAPADLQFPIGSGVHIKGHKGIPVEERGHVGVVENYWPGRNQPYIIRFANGDATGYHPDEIETL